MLDWNSLYAAKPHVSPGGDISALLKLIGQDDIVSFAGGAPDPASFPYEAVRAAADAILSDGRRRAEALQYHRSEGYAPLRAWVAEDMGRLGLRCDAENVLLLNGSQQALDFAARLFLDPGATVLVQEPTFMGALQAFDAFHATYAPLDSTPDAWPGPPRLLYVMPEFQNPTGRTLDAAARLAVAEHAAALGMPVLEDNAYERLRYEGEQLPCLAALALDGRHVDEGRVLFCGTFSKSLAPGLRIAFLVGPRPVIQAMTAIKQGSDLQAGTLGQMIVHDVVSGPGFSGHVDRIQAHYRAKRDVMLAALARSFPNTTQWNSPHGGLFVWVEGPPGLDGHALLRRSVEEARVAFVPGRAFHADRASGAHTFRLSFSTAAEADIEAGIGRLGRVLRDVAG